MKLKKKIQRSGVQLSERLASLGPSETSRILKHYVVEGFKVGLPCSLHHAERYEPLGLDYTQKWLNFHFLAQYINKGNNDSTKNQKRNQRKIRNTMILNALFNTKRFQIVFTHEHSKLKINFFADRNFRRKLILKCYQFVFTFLNIFINFYFSEFIFSKNISNDFF